MPLFLAQKSQKLYKIIKEEATTKMLCVLLKYYIVFDTTYGIIKNYKILVIPWKIECTKEMNMLIDIVANYVVKKCIDSLT